MFEQDINLLPIKFRKVYIPFSTYKVIQLVAAVSMIALGLSAGLFYYKSSLERHLASVEEHYQKVALELDQFKAKNARIQYDQKMAVQIKKYEILLSQRQQFLQKLNGQDFGNTRGFSEYLLALARQTVPEIWIEEIALQGNAEGVGLRGQAVNATYVTEFLQNLQNEPAVKGVTFDDMTLSRNPLPQGDFIGFNLTFGNLGGIGSSFESDASRVLSGLGLPNPQAGRK